MSFPVIASIYGYELIAKLNITEIQAAAILGTMGYLSTVLSLVLEKVIHMVRVGPVKLLEKDMAGANGKMLFPVQMT